jgi:predicted nucleic acid-binding protein
MSNTPEVLVVDASVLVDLLARTPRAPAAIRRLRRTVLHAPAHLDAEVLSALGRLHRAGELSVADVSVGVSRLVDMPMTRHPLVDLVGGAWARRDQLRLTDALYVELAAQLKVGLLTTDLRLARTCSDAEAIDD